MAFYVNVPKDLSKVKNKVAFKKNSIVFFKNIFCKIKRINVVRSVINRIFDVIDFHAFESGVIKIIFYEVFKNFSFVAKPNIELFYSCVHERFDCTLNHRNSIYWNHALWDFFCILL